MALVANAPQVFRDNLARGHGEKQIGCSEYSPPTILIITFGFAFRLSLMSAHQSRIPPEPRETADIIGRGRREFAAKAPSLLKKKVVELVFLPWLSGYTGSLMRAAMEEERRLILAALPPNTVGRTRRPDYQRGHNDALDQVRDIILARSA